MVKTITALSLGALLLTSSLFGAERPASSDASNLQEIVSSAKSSLSDMKGRFQGKQGFSFQGENLKVVVGSTANAWDKDILERQLPSLEKSLVHAAEKFSDAAENLPTNEGYTIFFQGCGETQVASRTLDVILAKVPYSKNFTADDFKSVKADIDQGLIDSNCL